MTQTVPTPLVDVEPVEPAPGTLVVQVRGELDAAGTATLADLVDRRLDDAPPGRLVLDLGAVTALGQAALGLLLRLHRRCRLRDVHLVLVGTGRPAVNQPLRISGLLPLFDTRPSVEAVTRQHRPPGY